MFITVRDSRNKVVDERIDQGERVEHGEWTFTLPAEGALGNYTVRAMLESDRPKPARAERSRRRRRGARSGSTTAPWKKTVPGSFLVAAYRRPDFRVDVTLTGDSRIAGDPLNGVVTARYLFGAPMGKRPTHWTFTRTPVFRRPPRSPTSFRRSAGRSSAIPTTITQSRTEMGSDDGR